MVIRVIYHMSPCLMFFLVIDCTRDPSVTSGRSRTNPLRAFTKVKIYSLKADLNLSVHRPTDGFSELGGRSFHLPPFSHHR